MPSVWFLFPEKSKLKMMGDETKQDHRNERKNELLVNH